jgi:hypothetical protein
MESQRKLDFLYPNLNDPQFNVKIAERKEFDDVKYHIDLKDVETESLRLCNPDRPFELAPHQQFVKNFLSVNTPYNSLLLYHGLGTGKTCSAIGVTEEMRTYMKQMNITRRIIIVASPNVQTNFRLQLFDDRKLQKLNGLWNIEACSGSRFLAEINPFALKAMSREKVLATVNRIIKTYYLFMGYIEFSNYIDKVKTIKNQELAAETIAALQQRKLEREFKGRMIVIDEVHNIRMADDNAQKRVAVNLEELVGRVRGIRLLFLSATPMYNSYREIIFLLNLMNINDQRPGVEVRDVFDAAGNFLVDDRGREVGKELLLAKSRGYVSFVKGDNPYVFPFRVYPDEFAPRASNKRDGFVYPEVGLNARPIPQAIERLSLYCVKIGDYQNKVYKQFISQLRADAGDDKFGELEKFGYTMLQGPIEALNIVYPRSEAAPGSEPAADNPKLQIGQEGLDHAMSHTTSKNPPRRYNYTYRKPFLDDHGHIFDHELIGDYSAKIKTICDNVAKATGIIIIYSQYLDGGLIPMALALESMGLTRYGEAARYPMLKRTRDRGDQPGAGLRYIMITGDQTLSPDNSADFKVASSAENATGELVKVVLISRAGSEGLDFKNIRQIHIMEPWYNTNRIEQIIGRGVRNCSHQALPFKDRNVMIFLYGTLLPNKTEAVDMYVYRTAEAKALKIGVVSRALKEGAVDCLLREDQQLTTAAKMNQLKQITLATGKKLQYAIGDKAYTQLCDFMENCDYSCAPAATVAADDITLDTYDELYLENNENIVKIVRRLFKERHFYRKPELLAAINAGGTVEYPLLQIYFALDKLIQNPSETIMDSFGRTGRLVNVGQYYFFQPSELDNDYVKLYAKTVPIDYKNASLVIRQDAAKEKQRTKQQKEAFAAVAAAEKTDAERDAEYQALLAKIEGELATTMTPEAIKKSNKDWYKQCALAVARFKTAGVSPELLQQLVVDHIVDLLDHDAKLLLLRRLLALGGAVAGLSPLETMLQKNMAGRVLESGSKRGLFLREDAGVKFYVATATATEGDGWREAEVTDLQDFKEVINDRVTTITRDMNDIVGFMINFKQEGVVFKTKQLREKRSKGARCNQASKTDTVKILNLILLKNAETERIQQKFTEEIVAELSILERCCYMELLLRFYDVKQTPKIWFLNIEDAILAKLEKFTRE